MSGPLHQKPFPQLSKSHILNTFKKSLLKNNCIQSLIEIFPEIFSENVIQPENLQSSDLNIDEAFLEPALTPKPMRLVLQKRVYVPKSPFSSSGYADDLTHRVWYYLDEGNNIQGPFTSLEMDHWFDSGFLFNELLIRIKEKNDFVKLVHLFGKTEMIQVYKPAPLSAIDHLYLHQQNEQAPRSAEIKVEDQGTEKPEKQKLEKKPSIYTFGFDEESSTSSPTKSPARSPGKAQPANNEAIESEVKKEEAAKTPVKKVEPQVVECEVIKEKVQEEKKRQIIVSKNSSETQEDLSIQVKKNESSSSTSTSNNLLEVKEQREDKNLLSPSGYKKGNGRPESSSKKISYVEVYEPKLSPSADKAKQDLRKNKVREQAQGGKQGTMLQYVVKEEKREEPAVSKEWVEKDKNKGGNQQRKNKNQDAQEKVKKEGPLNSSGKKGPTVVLFVPKKKDEVIYVEKPKNEKRDTYDRTYAPKEVKEDVLPDLQPVAFQRKESDTFEILKATSEYYQTNTTKDSVSLSEDKQALPPGLQADIPEPVIAPKNLVKKPKEKLKLVSHPYNDYETEQDRIVATSLGLLDLEEEAVPSKKMPIRSQFKNNSATPSPLIIDNGTVGKLYNFSEDLKYSSFSNQTEEFTIKDC